MRIFAGDRVRAIMERLKLPEGEPIEAGMVTRSIETAQRKVEGRNFDIRKQLLEYDDVANDQRKVLYSQRNEVLEAASVGAMVENLRDAAVTEMFNTFVPPESVEEQWDVPALQKALEADWQIQLPLTEMLEKEPNITDEDLRERGRRRAPELHVEGRAGGHGIVVAVRALDHAAGHRHALARAPVLAGLPAPGHPSARLRAEEPQAGIQARSLRAVLRHAGPHPRRCGAGADDGAGAVAGAG